MREEKLHRLWWLWIPAVFMGFQVGIEFFLFGGILTRLHSEGGPHESLQFLVLLMGFTVAAHTFFLPQLKSRPWLRAWMGLAAICCFYVAGEEISWGQQLLHWTTPEFWSAINDQNETNLHNTSAWFDQKPRLVLEIGVLVGGIVIPLLSLYKPLLVPLRFSVVYPPLFMAVPACFAIGSKIIDKVDQSLKNIVIFHRPSEVEELYLFYFVLLYLVILRRRILQQQG